MSNKTAQQQYEDRDKKVGTYFGSRECVRCDKPAVKQTVKGKHNEESGGKPINDGWYCQECWDAGLELEREAMYG